MYDFSNARIPFLHTVSRRSNLRLYDAHPDEFEASIQIDGLVLNLSACRVVLSMY